MRRVGVFVAIVLVLGLFLWAGVYNMRQRRKQMQDAQEHLVALSRSSPEMESAEPPDAAGNSLRGKPAPVFTLTSTAGKKVSLADFKGRPVVVNFWATWCGPCKLEMPWFEEFSHKYQDKGLVVLGLSQDEGTAKEDIAAAAKKLGVSYPILLPDEKVAQAYGGVDYLPETFYVDKDGNVLAETAGAPTKDQMEANVRKILAASGM